MEVLKKWSGVSVDLAALSESIREFLESEGFTTIENKMDEGYKVSGFPRGDCTLREKVIIEVQGNPRDFTLRFIAPEHGRSSVWLGILTSVIGGGGLILKGLKDREALEEFERDFWSYIEETMTQLSSSK